MARRRTLTPPPGVVPVRRGLAREPASDEETANTESQQMLAIGLLLKKPKTDDKDMQQFHAKVGADRKRLTALLDQRKQQAEEAETRRRNELVSTIMNTLQTPNRPVQGETPTYSGSKIAKNAAYALVAENLAASERLLREYERLDNMSREMQDDEVEPITATWNQELVEAEHQLKMGARVALRNVKKVLGAEDDGTGATDGDGDQVMQEAETGQELNYELHKGLRYAERGVRRMVKGLGEDKE
ncbi:hypothetical protein CC86DRAFT_316313 [Ophiobolus disseminans]|uniref:Uncharacterized protein n=1 Tax=Ophiobolus disseminans TaxID=1469910 RepID=A0A6A7ABS5_9PLEO|nr:hypothetical protein CC86DRAFT_316313 [Ophiobolus disseminans]